MTDSPVFVVGCIRSGTGLLRDLLRSHPSLALPSESHFIPSFYRGFGDPHSDRAARGLAARILRLRWVREWELSLSPACFAHCRSYSELVSEVYQEFARRHGKQRWGDKTPQYVHEISTLLEIFPAARIIHIHRDGRDVAMSMLATGFGPRNVFTAATEWRRRVMDGRRQGRRAPASYLEVRYETLLSRPEDTMHRVCAFIGEDFDEAVLRPSSLLGKSRPPIVGIRPPGRVASKTQVVTSNTAKWKHAMSAEDRSLFEGVAGDLLSSLGYETEGVARSLPRGRRLAYNAQSSSRLLLRKLNMRDRWPETVLLTSEAGLRYRLRAAVPRPQR